MRIENHDLDRDILNKVKNIHFIGIGGSGMCPLAEILHAENYNIAGSDISEGDTLARIRSYGIEVYMGHRAENIDGAELVVYTSAVKHDNPELLAAQSKGIPTVERCEMLGLISDRYKKSVAVAGTHGKTTTTGMLTQVLVGSGYDPTAVIGGRLPYIGGNGRVGSSEVMVCEACEYVDSFLELHPAISIILNIDADHLDYFGDLNGIKRSFKQFVSQTTELLVVNGDDENSCEVVADSKLPKLYFGFGNHNDYYAENITAMPGARQCFDLMHGGEKLATVHLSVPGKHNVLNALACATVAAYLGDDGEKIAKNLESFKGVHRRFEILGKKCGITVADDFAHHPTELTATLTAAMSMGFKTVWAVFQPHTYSRTAMLLDDFAKALSIADKVVLSEILPVREVNTYNIYSKDLAEKIDGCVWFKTFEEISDYVCENAGEGDLIITLGGGNVYMCANMIYKKLSEKED